MYENIINNKCIVRSSEAGVYFGTVTEINGETVRIENVRNIWRWDGAGCLSQVANDGIRGGKVSPVVSSMVLNGCCQIIPCSGKAIENLESQRVWEC